MVDLRKVLQVCYLLIPYLNTDQQFEDAVWLTKDLEQAPNYNFVGRGNEEENPVENPS